VPADRWNVERFYDAEPGIVGKTIAKRGGFVEGIDQFDPQFFGISPREAPYIDPQQRLLLETAWEAIEDAGVVLDLDKGTDMGVFVGISHNDYQGLQHTSTDRAGISAHTPTGSAHSIAANRISYCLNLTGPSIAMDTACSSALTAVHVACEHILRWALQNSDGWRCDGDDHARWFHRLLAGRECYRRKASARPSMPRPMASCAVKARAWC